jgi:hypothetical protein
MHSNFRFLLKSGAIALALALPAVVGAQTAAPTAAPAAAPSPDKVVARAEGIAVTEGDLAMAAEDPALSLPGMGDAQKRDLLVSYMVDLKLGAKAAAAAKVGDSPDFARKLAYFRDKLLLDEYLDREVKKAVTPEAARALYDETVKTMKPEPEVRARHILVEQEDEAKKAHARVKGGESFEKVAEELSKDPGSKGEGGDLGFFAKDRMVALRRGRLQARAGPGLGAGEEPVRLARHQGRGEAREADPALRGDEGAGRPVPHPQGPAGPRAQAAPERQDRAPRRAEGERGEAGRAEEALIFLALAAPAAMRDLPAAPWIPALRILRMPRPG